MSDVASASVNDRKPPPSAAEETSAFSRVSDERVKAPPAMIRTPVASTAPVAESRVPTKARLVLGRSPSPNRVVACASLT